MSARDDNPPGPGTAPADRGEPVRLLDDAAASADASATWALGLLRGAEPYKVPAGRKQRVQLRVGPTPRHRAPLLLRLAVISAVLFAGAGIVSASLGHWPGWMARAYERVVGRPPAGHVSATSRARAPRREAPPLEAPPAAAVEASDTPAPAALVAPPPPVARDVIAPRARRTTGAAPAPAGEDTSAVSAAMRALRVERNPARARVLLARYLAEHPNGNLAEEALAMTIEAAVAHDDADVAALAARYLRLYPHGSFDKLARDALARQTFGRNTPVAQPPSAPQRP